LGRFLGFLFKFILKKVKGSSSFQGRFLGSGKQLPLVGFSLGKTLLPTLNYSSAPLGRTQILREGFGSKGEGAQKTFFFHFGEGLYSLWLRGRLFHLRVPRIKGWVHGF